MRSVREAPKRVIKLSLNSKALEMAKEMGKEMGMNISRTVDELLIETGMKRYWAEWNVNNKEAVDHYHARIKREGTFAQRMQRHRAESAGKAATPDR